MGLHTLSFLAGAALLTHGFRTKVYKKGRKWKETPTYILCIYTLCIYSYIYTLYIYILLHIYSVYILIYTYIQNTYVHIFMYVHMYTYVVYIIKNNLIVKKSTDTIYN